MRRLFSIIKHITTWLWRRFVRYWRKNVWHKIVVTFTLFILLCLGTMYGIARWYIAQESSKPLVLGATFIPAYAESLGLDPHATFSALINDLGIRNFRLVSYWDELEPELGQYDFSSLDWQFQQAEAAHANITLSIGLRQPRWPECHVPSWAANETPTQWEPQLDAFITAVVNRYKNSPSLQSYQLENEYFLTSFGTCTNDDRQRLVNEFNLVKKLDPNHTLIISRSQNALGISLGRPRPDELAFSIYKRVWTPLLHRYIEYPFPAWYYAFWAGLQKITTGRDTIIHELQAEPWPPNGQTIPEISLTEQNKSFNAKRLEQRYQLAKGTGMRTIYFWGAEYWYYRYTVEHDSSVWNTAKTIFQQQPN